MKYFLDQDNDCHWYLIDASKRQEWEAWRDLDGDDEESWNVPDFAIGIDHPNEIEFEYREH